MVIVPFLKAHWLIIVAAVYVIGLRLSTVSTDELEQLLCDGFLDAMHRAGLNLKAMAYAMRRGEQDTFDEAQLRRQLARERGQHISLFRLLGCPMTWWCYFGPSLMAIVARKRWAEMQDEAEAMRADLRAAVRRSA